MKTIKVYFLSLSVTPTDTWMLYADRPASPNDEQSYLKWLFLPKQRVHTVENGQMDTFNDFLKAFNGLSIKSG